MRVKLKAEDDPAPVPSGFVTPTALPSSEAEAASWQDVNRSWWEKHPMRYDFQEALGIAPGTQEFYREIDRRFLSATWTFMPWKKKPFEELMDFDRVAKEDVLEIGVGMGTHAQLLAGSAKSFTGIDLTQMAIDSTTERFRLFGLDTSGLRRMDAEHLEFPDNSFDFVWSWGVIHHSSNTRRVLEEIRRVLRPGGRLITMVYHRNFWNWQIIGGFFHGVLRAQWLKHNSLNEIMQQASDGGIARYYSADEWRATVSDLFPSVEIRVYGDKGEMLPIPGGAVKNAIMKAIPDSVVRLFGNKMKMGRFLVAEMR